MTEIPKQVREHFDYLCDCLIEGGRIALMSAKHHETGRDMFVACLVTDNPMDEEKMDLYPVAEILQGDPTEYIAPPDGAAITRNNPTH